MKCMVCDRWLMIGESYMCGACAAEHDAGRLEVVRRQLAWDTDIQADFAASPRVAVGQVGVDREKFGSLVWDLVWLSGQDPWRNAVAEGAEGRASVAFFGRYEGRPFVVHDLRGRGPTLYVVGAPDLPGQDVLDAVFRSLEFRPWFGHAEPGLVM